MAAKGGKEMEIAIKIAGKVQSSFKSALNAAGLEARLQMFQAKGLKPYPKALGLLLKQWVLLPLPLLLL